LSWQFIEVEAGKWRRYLSLSSISQNIVDVFRTIAGFFQAIRILRKTRARLVVSKGGYVALPVLYAARVVGCPIIVHESDSVMGVTNRIGSRFAKRVLTAFDETIFPERDARYRKIGIPIRRSLRQAASLRSPKKVQPLLLVLPGSQGSTAINQYIRQGLRELLQICDVVHLTGTADYESFETLRKGLPENLVNRYHPYRFIDRQLPYYYQSADLIVLRASATTAAEAALFSKPVYVIPLPESANNHQQENARRLEQADAAIVKQQYQLSTEQFIKDIKNLLGDNDKLVGLGKNLAAYFDSSNAVSKMTQEITDASQD
jgi:UDP-N-acetylglucosamine--N-acetylmuramyl-(pentapeptide) pyrophosphoryl-undecaprenol N-acetylglucosamine transferase